MYVDEDSYTVNTSRTASPDFVPETPPPSSRVILETPTPGEAKLQAEIARLHERLRYRRRHYSRRGRSGREDLEAESSDSEAGD